MKFNKPQSVPQNYDLLGALGPEWSNEMEYTIQS